MNLHIGTHLHALLSGSQTLSSTAGPSAERQEDSTPVFSPAAQDEALPETSETNPPASLSFLQQTNDADQTAQAASTAHEMGAFEQGPEVADSVPKEVTPAHAAGNAEGMSFMQTSELPTQQMHQQSTFQNDHSQVQQGAHESGPGMGMENAYASGEAGESAPAPSVAQLEGQAVSFAARLRNSSVVEFDGVIRSFRPNNPVPSTGQMQKTLTTFPKLSVSQAVLKRLWLQRLHLLPLKARLAMRLVLLHPLLLRLREECTLLSHTRAISGEEVVVAAEVISDLEAGSATMPTTTPTPTTPTTTTTTTLVTTRPARKEQMRTDFRSRADEGLPCPVRTSRSEVAEEASRTVNPQEDGEGVAMDVSACQSEELEVRSANTVVSSSTAECRSSEVCYRGCRCRNTHCIVASR